jgi:hypothetical protein
MPMSKRPPVADERHVGEEAVHRTPLRTRSGGRPRPQEIIRLLRAWRQGDEAEQQETLRFLKEALDADRPSYRKLFP